VTLLKDFEVFQKTLHEVFQDSPSIDGVASQLCSKSLKERWGAGVEYHFQEI